MAVEKLLLRPERCRVQFLRALDQMEAGAKFSVKRLRAISHDIEKTSSEPCL
jgi:hypothetical protein